LHRNSGWHGNAALRNLMFGDGQIGMIDFENAAHRWLSLTGRQAFDAWQVVHSLAQFDDREALIGAFLSRYEPAAGVSAWLRRFAWALSPLLLLGPIAGGLKRDFRQGVYGLRAIFTYFSR
jgi:Ser/Thr protein kinase RdoA (MazF antagonist)